MANYKPVADKYANQYGIPRGLFRELVKWESGWDQNAGSPAGALGFTQLMPGTASGMGINPHDPAQNLLGGARYLREQHDAFAGLAKKIGVNPWALALAAYNAGPNAVRKYGGIPPYAETQKYVKGILAAAGHFTTMPGATPAPTSAGTPAAPALAAAPAAPDFSSVAFDNLSHISSGSFSPSESLSALTQAVAAQPPPASTPTPQAAPAAPSAPHGPQKQAAVVGIAKQYLGTPYLWGGEDPKKGFDCSGLIQYVQKQMGVNISRTTYDQVKEGAAVDLKHLQPGDAIFLEPTKKGPGHVVMYIGNGKVIAAPHTGDVVKIQDLSYVIKADGYVAARRYS